MFSESGWLYQWQTLVGAFIGGIVGLLAALLVAYKNRRHDENVASMTVLLGLNAFITAAEVLEERKRGQLARGASQQQADAVSISYLLEIWPLLPTLFEVAVARILYVDTELSVRLSNFLTITTLLSSVAFQKSY